MAFVAARIGISVMPKMGAIGPPAGVAIRPLVNPTPVRSIHAVVRDAVSTTPPARAAVELLRTAATHNGAGTEVPTP